MKHLLVDMASTPATSLLHPHRHALSSSRPRSRSHFHSKSRTTTTTIPYAKKNERKAETSSSSLFLDALDKVQRSAADEDEGDEYEFGDEDEVEDDTNASPSSSASLLRRAPRSQQEEDELVLELLAAAGLNDQGLPSSPHAVNGEDQEGTSTNASTTPASSTTATTGTKSRRRRRADDAQRRLQTRIPDELLPRVAIIGRPNVGKSALFNRLVGRQVAIVYDYPGVTRDRLYTRAAWGTREFMLMDTGGLMSDASALPRDQQAAAMHSVSAAGLPQAIERQAAAAVEEADALVVVVDGQTGSTAADDEVIAWLRKYHPDKPITLAVNKCENVRKADEQAAEFWSTGLVPIATSAISGTGSGELLDAIVAVLPPAPPPEAWVQETEDKSISLAIVGRPNVGKSSLLNALVGEERSIVSDMAGTTRDAIDIDITYGPDGQVFTLIDTAGVRKRASVASTQDGAEPLMVERAFRAVRRAELAVLVIDATEGITQQDFRLAEYIAAEGRGCVVVVNKWDAVPDKTNTTLADYEANVRAQLRPVEWANVVFTSAKTGQRVKRVLDAAIAAAAEHRRRITTATLNLVIQDATGWRSPPSTGSGKRGKIYYGTQAGIKPPTFVLFCNDPVLFGDDYRKYMERQFRENVGFPGSPLRLYWRGKGVSTDGGGGR